jgi:hypothetical protein
MDDRIAKLNTYESCEKFIRNALRLGRRDLAEQARQRAIAIRADAHGAASIAEKECLQAIYAYEEVISQKRGRRIRATRTWQMVKRHGILRAAERAVTRSAETAGYAALAELGLHEFAFEAVILRYPQVFTPEAVERSRLRLQHMDSACAE